jgi:hypothetical protein
MRPELYQHTHRATGRWCPAFTRFAVNFSEPWTYRRGFWESHEPLDKSGPNYKIEITVTREEALPLAEWLPSWLTHREKITSDLSDPPRGMDGLLLWLPSHGHAYFWSEAANMAYESWMAEQKELAEQRGVGACR